MDEAIEKTPVQARIDEIHKALKRAKVPAHIRKLLEGTIKNVAWLEVKLDEAMAAIPEGEITREYDNGGGQKGTQKSPQLKAYEELFRDYTSGMDEIMAALPRDAKEPVQRKPRKREAKNTLEKIKGKKMTP